jgi:hypothetical protein
MSSVLFCSFWPHPGNYAARLSCSSPILLGPEGPLVLGGDDRGLDLYEHLFLFPLTVLYHIAWTNGRGVVTGGILNFFTENPFLTPLMLGHSDVTELC